LEYGSSRPQKTPGRKLTSENLARVISFDIIPKMIELKRFLGVAVAIAVATGPIIPPRPETGNYFCNTDGSPLKSSVIMLPNKWYRICSYETRKQELEIFIPPNTVLLEPYKISPNKLQPNPQNS
jgi:hypothetical protein